MPFLTSSSKESTWETMALRTSEVSTNWKRTTLIPECLAAFASSLIRSSLADPAGPVGPEREVEEYREGDLPRNRVQSEHGEVVCPGERGGVRLGRGQLLLFSPEGLP